MQAGALFTQLNSQLQKGRSATMVYDNFDAPGYACVNHRYLLPDAWHSVRMGRPVGDGAEAALVCRYSCPARDRCPVTNAVEVIDTVAAGGWYNHKGQFVQLEDDELELHQAAAFVGLSLDRFKRLIQRVGVHPSRRVGSLVAYQLKEIEELAATFGPAHRSATRLRQHQLLGQDCDNCNAVLAAV